jgi:phosphotriesterase-related protein
MPQINTVLGPIHPAELGVCSLHERLLRANPGWQYSPQAEQLFDAPRAFEKVFADLVDFRRAGGRSIVDTSTAGQGRDPELFAAWSRYSGVQIIGCTGFGSGVQLLPYFQERDQNTLTQFLVDELTRGMGPSSIRAGAIAVGLSPGAIITPEGLNLEELTCRAAAQAQRQTGAPIIAHGVGQIERLVEILLEAGAAPSRTLISHLDAADSLDAERDVRLAKQGFNLGYDHVGLEPDRYPRPDALPDQRRVEQVRQLIEAGHLDQIVLASSAVGWNVSLKERESPHHSFCHLLQSFLLKLGEAGLSQAQLQAMLVETPRRFLTIS